MNNFEKLKRKAGGLKVLKRVSNVDELMEDFSFCETRFWVDRGEKEEDSSNNYGFVRRKEAKPMTDSPGMAVSQPFLWMKKRNGEGAPPQRQISEITVKGIKYSKNQEILPMLILQWRNFSLNKVN